MNYQPIHKISQNSSEKSSLQRINSTKQIQTLGFQRLQKYVLSLQNVLLKKQIELYQWRQKTDFPIVKIQSFKIIQQKLQKTHLQVIINSNFQRLNQINSLKIQDVTVLIKQAFVGFERLFNKFKLFQVQPEMIIIDQKGKCRVWVNANFSLNQIQKQAKDFQTFYKDIVSTFENITIKNPTSMNFYLCLKSCNCFIKGLKVIQEFIKSKKIKPNQKPNVIKKISSTPNLQFDKNQKILYPIQQESKNLRQTIGYLRKRQHLDYNQPNQTMTFSGKNSKPLQKRLQQMIQQLPKNQIVQKNNIIFDKFKDKNHQQKHQNLKKVFKNIKDFKFRKNREELPNQQKKSNQDNIHQKPQIIQRFNGSQKFRSQTARNSPQKNSNLFETQNYPTTKNIEENSRFSITQTRSTSFFNNSGQRLCQYQNMSYKKFGNIKFSQISHKKNSEFSQFNKEIENILFGIDDKQSRQLNKKKQINSIQNISMKFLHENDNQVHKNLSILQHEDLTENNFKKFNLELQQNKTTQLYPSQKISTNLNNKYGQISDQIQEPTAQQISQKYIELGWKPKLNILSFQSQQSQMKKSIHANQEQSGLSCNGNQKVPITLGKLDRIKNKQLVQSVMNQEYFK